MKKVLLLFLLIGGFMLMSCGNEGNQVLLIIPSHSVEDTELTVTRSVLEEAGYIVDVASLGGADVTGMHGGNFQADLAVEDAKAKDYAMVTCIGGNGSFDLYNNDTVHQLVQSFDEAEKPVSAICAAPGILANAGILEGEEATCFPYHMVTRALSDNGAEKVDQPVVVSGRIITADGAESSQLFGEALVEMLERS